ncbi:biotin--[acetyl-CoA-carboxylase] ligase [Gayadomonas joobiniege]|uniref:biotin--[acetyl-CoA-carboxylase] ligase n=1 Tax=Gayadomonas joobiniege TaxID=1234606 RepID=UPI00036EC2E3|nr:biotin--[acetyl-CoA-carboxylase] ligase [Gayadomonas joobiniege]
MQLDALLEVLCDGQCHSGQALSQQFNISRTSISKWIKRLIEAGYPVDVIPGKGYQFAADSKPLNFGSLAKALPQRLDVQFKRSTESTNLDVKQALKAGKNAPLLVIAERQTAGRGRRGRDWYSPFAQNIYFSLGLSLNLSLAELSGLSIRVGLAVADCLRANGWPVQLKWPNDIYLDGAKLGGILVELEGAFDPPCLVIIGIGLNVNMTKNAQSIEQAWQSLAQFKGQCIQRDKLCQQLVQYVNNELATFSQPKSNVSPIAERWRAYDLYLNQPVNVISAADTLKGINTGINEQGNLILATESGDLSISGGEVSLRSGVL